jgi:DNA polymerase
MIDFETFFSKTYHMGRKKGSLSTIEYIESRQFEVLGVGTLMMAGGKPYFPHRSPAMFWPDAREHLTWLQSRYGRNLERCTVASHNARFDGTILTRKFGITPPYYVDTMALSAHLDARNMHSLADVCERLGLPPKGDTSQFEGRHWADMDDAERDAMHDYCCNDCERQMDVLELLLPRLTRPGVELSLIRHTLGMFWQPKIAFEFALAGELIAKMDAQVVADTAGVGMTPAQIRSGKFVSVLGEALAVTGDEVPMKRGKNKDIAALAKDDEGLKDLLVHRNPRVRQLVKARQSVKSWPLHQKRLRSMVAQAQAAGGLLCNPLRYYGAHTGRWSGGEGINTANLPTRGGGLQCEIKHCLIAQPGEVFVMGDAAQIEARGVAWFAGQEDLLNAFAQSRDVYSEFAAEVLAQPVRKARKDDPTAVQRLFNGRRTLGKVGILGMGYGMGKNRALEYMLTYPELEPKVESGEIDLEFCRRFVDKYRSKYSRVPKFWRDIEDAFRFVTKYGKEKSLQGLRLSRDGTMTAIGLPSGRHLFYPQARITGSFPNERLAYRWGDLWGGTLTENVVQAASRDVLAETILFVESYGFSVVHHVYDSIVVACPEDRAEAAEQVLAEALTRTPAWANGWPMDVETTIAKRYE